MVGCEHIAELRRGAADDASAVLAPFVERDVLDDAGRRVAAQVKLAQQAASAGDIEAAASAAERNCARTSCM